MMTSKHIDRQKNPPTIVGQHGAAWAIDSAEVRRVHGKGEDEDATVGAWIVFAPWANIAWAYYLLSVVHLRPMPKLGPAKIALMGATHEIVVAALDPRQVPLLTDPGKTMLRPLNYVGQWVVQQRNPVDADLEAATTLGRCVDEVLAGVLSPDTDFVREWIKRFGDSNLR